MYVHVGGEGFGPNETMQIYFILLFVLIQVLYDDRSH